MRSSLLAIAFASLHLFGCAHSGPGDPPHDGGPGIDGSTSDFAVSGDLGPSCQSQCSSDLRQLLDCNGQLIATCTADQACTASGCMPACEAATVNRSSVGCDYYSVKPDSISFTQGYCYAAYVANTWTTPATINVDRQGATLNVADFARIPSGGGSSLSFAPLTGGKLQPGEVAVLFLQNGMGCPSGITPPAGDPAVHGTGRGDAFHITSDVPVVAYDIFPFGGGSTAVTSATLLLPTSAWDINYVAVEAYPQTTASAAGYNAHPFLEIVAAEDATSVTIKPKVAIEGSTGSASVAAAAAGTATTYMLDKGQILQFAQAEELTGSAILADKPIGVWGGASGLNIPVDTEAADAAHQQIPAVKALGHEYVAVRYRNRIDGMEESPPWRLVGAVDGTTLSYSPSPPAGAPATLDAGQVVEFPAAGPFVVSSQDSDHPFYVAGYMTGCFDIGGYGSPIGCAGDPEFVNAIPPQQYLDQYVFLTDPTYPETDLVVVRHKTGGMFHDVTLDCAGVLTGWTPVSAGGDYEYTRVDLVRGNFTKQGTCDNGRHTMTSDVPFGLTVWGWGSNASTGFMSQAVSYAYPAGARLQVINSVVVSVL